jgi:hypothetical protein
MSEGASGGGTTWPGRITFRFDSAVRSIDVHVEAPLLTNWLYARGDSGLTLEDRIDEAIASNPLASELRVDKNEMELLCSVLTEHEGDLNQADRSGLRSLKIAVCGVRLGDTSPDEPTP